MVQPVFQWQHLESQGRLREVSAACLHPWLHLQEDTGSGQGTDSNNTDAVTTSSAQASSGKGKKDPNAPRFQLTNTQFAAPFLLTSIGEQHPSL
jgi:hypothetical protein